MTHNELRAPKSSTQYKAYNMSFYVFFSLTETLNKTVNYNRIGLARDVRFIQYENGGRH